jgi:hypothetical protein
VPNPPVINVNPTPVTVENVVNVPETPVTVNIADEPAVPLDIAFKRNPDGTIKSAKISEESQ